MRTESLAGGKYSSYSSRFRPSVFSTYSSIKSTLVLGLMPRSSSRHWSLQAGFLTRMSVFCRAWTSLERTRAAAVRTIQVENKSLHTRKNINNHEITVRITRANHHVAAKEFYYLPTKMQMFMHCGMRYLITASEIINECAFLFCQV